MNLDLFDANNMDLEIINDLMRNSKAHWGYDDNFMHKFMDLFQLTVPYLETNIVKLLYVKQADSNETRCLAGFFSLSIFNDNNLELDNFFISPCYIGKGYGKILWNYLLNTVKGIEKKEFILWSDPGADGFYEKMGCIKVGTKKSPMMPDRHPVVFKYLMGSIS